jgi:uncharacterized protein (TIGR03118 family)
MHRLLSAALAASIAAVLLAAGAPAAPPPPLKNSYAVAPLVSNNPALAPTTDSNVQNAWGLARGGGTPWWIADNGTAKTSVYTAAGTLVAVGGHDSQDVPGAPTGAVFSFIAGEFQVGTTSTTTLAPSNFIFASEDGTISAWRTGSTAALVKVDMSSSGAVFKGLAISNGASGARLYATDFAQGTGHARVDVFDGGWTLLNTPGAFVDPKLPKHFAPFGIQTIGDRVFVTYAKQQPGSNDEAHGHGLGIVDAYDLDGNFLARVAQHGQLDAPWGLAWAPAGFGRFGGDLLVGNFGNGQINAYEEMPDGHFHHRGTLHAAEHGKLKIDGLWALEFGNTGSNGDPQTLFFTAGPNDEADGLFGKITASG